MPLVLSALKTVLSKIKRKPRNDPQPRTGDQR